MKNAYQMPQIPHAMQPRTKKNKVNQSPPTSLLYSSAGNSSPNFKHAFTFILNIS